MQHRGSHLEPALFHALEEFHSKGNNSVFGITARKGDEEMKAKHLLPTCTLGTTKWCLQEILVSLFEYNNFAWHKVQMQFASHSPSHRLRVVLLRLPWVVSQWEEWRTDLLGTKKITHISSYLCTGIVNGFAHLPTSWGIGGQSVN